MTTSESMSPMMPKSTLNSAEYSPYNITFGMSTLPLQSSPSSQTPGDWFPAGVYIPVHRRADSGTSTTSNSTQSSLQTPKSELPTPTHSSSRVYSRETLLALAPSSLAYVSLHPIISPTLLSSHPTILNAQGDGVARALAMAHASSNTFHTFPRRYRSLRSKPAEADKRQKQEQAQQVPQTRRRDCRSPCNNNRNRVTNISSGRAAYSASMSKNSPRRQFDLSRSWRSSQPVIQ